MNHVNIAVLGGSILPAALVAGCGTGPAIDKEPSTSTIRAAEEVGAASG